MKSRLVCVALLTLGAVLAPAANACTTFCLDKGQSLVFGKNYDWNVEDGMVVVNRRGIVKTALTDDHPARWTSRFGSVTFNQYGREFPSGGMNEAGLVIELMWLDETTYPEADIRHGLPTLQWIQYQLDVSATVDDVVSSDKVVRIASGGSAKIHFLIADAKRGCASIEYLGGRMVVHRGDTMPFTALTNDTYEASAAYAKKQESADGSSSLDRFVRAAQRTKVSPARGAETIHAAFGLLDDVAQGDYTQWSIVYDIGKRRALFRTRLNREIRWLNLEKLDFACGSTAMAVDMNAPLEGDLTAALVPCTLKMNLALVNAAFTKTDFLRTAPIEVREELARYPESLHCAP